MPHPVNEDTVPISELLALLDASVRCADAATSQLRFDVYDTQQRVVIGLWQAIIEYARAVAAVVRAGTLYAPVVLARSALDAYVDLVNACVDRDYSDHLAAADTRSWRKVLERASSGRNPYLAALAEEDSFVPGRRMFSERGRELEQRSISKLEIDERFRRAGMTVEYEAVWSILSAEAHNNISFITSRYFDLRSERPGLRDRESRASDQHGYDKACTLNMAEIVVTASERVMQLCGHGTAVIASARIELDRIRAMFGFVTPAA